MSNPSKHEPLSDDLFRNRIAVALRELDLPESDADIAAALDAVVAEPLSDEAVQRIMERVRTSMVKSAEGGSAANASRVTSVEQLAGHVLLREGPVLQSARPTMQIGIVAACAAALLALGLVFQRADDGDPTPLAGRDHSTRKLLPGELISSHDRASLGTPASGGSRFETQAGSSSPSALLASPSRVKVGDTLTTGPREKRRVTLPDGSVLSINERSRVSVVRDRRVKLLAGEVFVEVVPSESSERFVVETPQRTVTALGTKFVVKAQERATNVVVTQGTVRVSGVENAITAGQELIADLTESKSAELRPAKRSAYVVEWVKDLMAVTGSIVVPTSQHAGGSVTVVDPQGQEMKLSLRKFHLDVHIEDGFARTTIDQTYFNHTWQQLEGTFRFPLPADASVSRLAMYVNGQLMEGGMVERDYGRNVFEQIRHTKRDPALLEWVDGSTFQMRVFPLEARQEKRILLSYTQRLANDYGRSVYRFPAGHSLDGVREWSAQVRAKGAAGTKWYSPSHLLNGRDEQGDLLLDGRDEYATLDRDLVVELGDEPEDASPRFRTANRGLAPSGSVSTPAWSLCEQDGFQYVMLRQRPELKANAERSQRHWVLLIENSADRNAVLAETQRQIAKIMLENAEHSDTFSLIRAGTQAESFRRKPAACSLENIAAAEQFLSGVAPIGALDLEQALHAVRQQARGSREVWIVHLGTGIPVLGERDDTALLRLLPTDARYVGVAVGKRWSKSFMETAARRTGGHVTQINPDEAVAWRAFDLLSTLNAPRLTEIAVHATPTRNVSKDEHPATATSEPDFLLLTTSLAHGQELAAVARFPKGQPLPQSVTITGKLNGKPYSQHVELPSNPISRRALAPGSGESSEREPDASAFRLIRHVGHLPRTWARSEIDRLVALGATEHKPQIIALSKSMYVMSPFTSLLVLETEAMYEQFKVDRGRKDHWALYPAPAEIPVVADLSVAQLSPLDAAKERLKHSQARAKSAQSNYERSVTEKRPATDLQRLDRLSRAEQADVRLIEREIKRIEQATVAAADPVRLAWESVVLRRTGWQMNVMSNANHIQHWHRRWGDLGWADRELDWHKRAWRSNVRFALPDIDGLRNINGEVLGVPLSLGGWSPQANSRNWFGGEPSLELVDENGREGRWREQQSDLFGRESRRVTGPSHWTFSSAADRFDVRAYHNSDDDDYLLRSQAGSLSFLGMGLNPALASGTVGLNFNTLGNLNARPNLDWNANIPTSSLDDVVQYTAGDSIRPRYRRFSRTGDLLLTNPQPSEFDQLFGDVDTDDDGVRDGLWLDLEPNLSSGSYFLSSRLRQDIPLYRFATGGAVVPLNFGNGRHFGTQVMSGLGTSAMFMVTPRIIIGEEEERLLGVSSFEGEYMLPQVGAEWRSLGTSLTNGYDISSGGFQFPITHPLAGVLQDLPSYAPGLQTWPADRLAIVEQAAATKPVRGEVDAEARRLIEKARSLGWESCRMAAPGRPALNPGQRQTAEGGHRTRGHSTGRVVLADGSGRFVFDREVSEGLKEQVIHDGSTLWHLYAEIALGAQRPMSRFHQSAIQSLIPWYVPSVDDLSVEADLRSVSERTVRITRRTGTPARPNGIHESKAEEGKQTDGQKCPSYEIAVELVFAEDGRLSALRVINIKANKVLANQTFLADGTVRLFDGEDKLVAEAQYERQPVEAPNLVPQTEGLVVLPLPYRSAAGVPVSVPVNLQTNAPDFAKLSDDDALKLLATYFAEARQSELATFIEQRYTSKGDHRLGLAVLLSSVMPLNPLVANATQQHPESSLANFLQQFSVIASSGSSSGTLVASDSASPFLKRVCSAYNHFANWSADRAITRELPYADLPHEPAATLNFLNECRSIDLAAKLLSTVHLSLKRTERMNAAFARQLNDATMALAEARGIPAFGRTTRIEWLLTVGDEASVTQAKELFRQQLEDWQEGTSYGLLGETRRAFAKHFKTPDGQPCGPWGELVKEAAKKFALKKFTEHTPAERKFAETLRSHTLIALARACIALTEPTLAAEIFQLAIQDQNLAAQTRLNLAALAYLREAANWDQAEASVRRALADEQLQKDSSLWRVAAEIAHHRKKFPDWIESLDKASELEFAALPKTLNLETFRQDYDRLFGQFDQRADQLTDGKRSEKLAFARVVQRAASRWRDIDPNDTTACHRTAAILTKLGLTTAAWNYWTTPLAETPDQSTVWQTFASAMQSQQRPIIVDHAWSTAFACEPTNPEILVQHALFLRSTRQEGRARELFDKVINSEWQPRFESTKQQARTLLNGGAAPK